MSRRFVEWWPQLTQSQRKLVADLLYPRVREVTQLVFVDHPTALAACKHQYTLWRKFATLDTAVANWARQEADILKLIIGVLEHDPDHRPVGPVEP